MFKRIAVFLIIISMLAMNLPTVSAATTHISGIKGWSISLSGDCQGTAEIDYDNGVDGTPCLKLVNHSDRSSDVYMLVTATLPVKKGKTYSYGGIVKSDNSASVETMISWGQRSSLLLYGKTFDFTKYEFMYSAATTSSIQLMFLIEGKTDGLWLDDMFFIDTQTGENLLKNPNFNEDEELDDAPKLTGENEYQRTFLGINESSEFDVDDAFVVSSLYKHLPVRYKKITVDAEASDWSETTMAYMPVDNVSQRVIYAQDDESEKDLKIEYAFAYDEDNLYMYYKVYDDLIQTYADIENYWRGDSIQIMLSHDGEEQGLEMGLIHDTITEKGQLFCSNRSDEALSTCQIATKRDGKYTIYEAAIPWNIKYDEKPDKILFDFIVNDNDYNGRKYCIQLAPGIAEGKLNAEYPTLDMLDPEQGWYAWVDGEIKPNINEEIIYNLYIVNLGKDKSFTIASQDGSSETVTVKTGKGFRKSIPVTLTEIEDCYISAKVEVDGKTYDVSHKVTTTEGLPKFKDAKLYQREVSEYVNVLEELIKKCEESGINTDYERINYQTIKYFAGYMADDIGQGDRTRIYYTYNQLKDLYNEAKGNLEAYLAGEKEPLSVPKFVDDEFTIDDTLMYAETYDGEKYEKRPVFFVGYGHFTTAIRQMNNFMNLGVNSIQSELGINRIIKSGTSLKEGSFTNVTADATCEVTTEISHSGKQAIKITNKSPKQSNIYSYFTQAMFLKPNTRYEATVWYYGINVNDIAVCDDALDGRHYITPKEEWQKLTFEFTSGADQYVRSFRILTEGLTEAAYFDDISVKEAETGEEVFYGGDFEFVQEEGQEYFFADSGFVHVLEMLARGEKTNISVDLLLSPHYMYSQFLEQHPDAKIPGGGFGNYDINHPAARKVLEDYVRYLMPKVMKYKSLNSICLVNEPSFKPNRSEAYKVKWYDFLKEKHGTIEVLNERYGTDHKDFSEIEMPVDMYANPICLDYQEFNDLQFSDCMNWLADLVHEIAPEIPVHCKFSPYIYFGEESHVRANMSGGYSLEYMTDHLDISGCDSWDFLYSSSGNSRGFEMWYDYQVSVTDAPVFDSEHHIMADRFDKFYSDEYDAYSTRNMWQGAIHYRANSVLWEWERTYDKSNDAWGLMTQRPKSVWGTGVVTNDLNRLAYEVEAIQKEKADIGILYSNATRIYDVTNLNLQYKTYDALLCLGKKVKFVTELQAEKMFNVDYLFVPGIDYVQESTLDHIINYIKSGGQVLIIGDDCFKYNEYMQDSNYSKRQFILDNSTIMSGIKSNGSNIVGMTHGEYKNLICDYLKSKDQIWIEVLDAKTGKLCEDLEYNVAFLNNKLLVNINNTAEDVDINVLVDGKKLGESTELRSMEKQGETVKAEKYMPILLEFEIDNPFFDTYNHWAKSNILSAHHKNLVFGVSSSRFKPNKGITRAEFVTMLTRAAEIRPEAYTGVYEDVSDTAWYAGYMQSAYSNGIIPDRAGRPNDLITREEMCNMLIRAYETNKKAEEVQIEFADKDNITDKTSVSKAFGLGIIKGYDDGLFRPQGNLTRAEATTVILNFYNLID